MSGTKVDMKVVLLGKEFGGKTSLVERFLNDRFLGDIMPYQNTIGAAYGARTLDIDGKKITLGIWDTAGSERYEAMSRIYYRGAKAAIVCYDLSDSASYQRLKFWVNELRQHEEACRLYLCGTKYDLVEDDPSRLRAIDHHNVQDFATDIGAELFETSSKSGYNIRELFQRIAERFMNETNAVAAAKTLNQNTVSLQRTSRKKSCVCGT